MYVILAGRIWDFTSDFGPEAQWPKTLNPSIVEKYISRPSYRSIFPGYRGPWRKTSHNSQQYPLALCLPWGELNGGGSYCRFLHGGFPTCPDMSCFVLFFPDLSPFWTPTRAREDKQGLSGPTATIILSCYAVALHSVTLRFPGLEGCRKRIALHARKWPCSTYLFSSWRGCCASSCLLEGVVVQGSVAAALSPVAL